MSRTVSVTLRYVDVDVELDEISTDQLRAELDERKTEGEGAVPSLSGCETHPLHEIYYAFKFGMDDRATALARAYVCDELGVVL